MTNTSSGVPLTSTGILTYGIGRILASTFFCAEIIILIGLLVADLAFYNNVVAYLLFPTQWYTEGPHHTHSLLRYSFEDVAVVQAKAWLCYS